MSDTRHDSDRLRHSAERGDVARLAETVEHLSRRNEELSAAVGTWRTKAMYLEEQVARLQATIDGTDDVVSGSEPAEADDQDVVEGDEPETRPQSAWERLRRWFAGG